MEMWVDHAERSLFVLATELRRIPLHAGTRRLHLRALELKRMIARWRDEPPDRDVAARTLEEVEALAREAQSRRRSGGRALEDARPAVDDAAVHAGE